MVIDFNIAVDLELLAKKNPEVKMGGRYSPKDCISPHKVAIIIPFRNRQEHLKYWLYYLHPVLQRQQLDYGIYVINQVRSGRRDKGGRTQVHECALSERRGKGVGSVYKGVPTLSLPLSFFKQCGELSARRYARLLILALSVSQEKQIQCAWLFRSILPAKMKE